MTTKGKSTKLALALVGALAFTVPYAVSASQADAAPMHGGMMMGNHDSMHDHGHTPPPRHENRPRMPHHGYHWHDGRWNWSHNQWVWIGGFWNIR